MAISVLEITATQITANGTLPVLNGSALTDLDAADLSTGAVPVLRLGSSGSRSSSTFLNGVNAWATPVGAVTALSGNVENRIATFGDTITELNGESTLTFGSGVLALTGSMTISTTLVATGTITTPSVLFKGTSNSVTIDADNPAAYTVILPNAAPTGGGKVLQTASGQATILEWGTPAAGLSLAGTTSGNQITTVNSSTEINGEANLTFDGTGQFAFANSASGSSTDFKVYSSATSGATPARLILRTAAGNTADTFMSFHGVDSYEYAMGVDNSDGDKFKISGSALGTNDKLIIESAGDVTVKTGNLVIGTAGKGIDFSANTDDEIGAGSLSSELLDDYEEGTFTAILKDSSGNSATQSQNSGRYTKIGNQVFVHIQVRLTSISGMVSGNTARIDGMPFAASSEAELGGGTFCWYASSLNMTNGGKYISANPEPSDTYMHMREWGENQEGVSTGLTVGEISADGHILMSGIIRT